MKVSTNLLKAIAVGVSLSASATSCSLFDDVSEEQQEICDETCEEVCTEHREGTWNCGPCGMG